MKQVLFLAVSLAILSCGGGSKEKSAKEWAKEVCECSEKANALPVSDPNRSIAQNDCMKKNVEVWKTVKEMEPDEVSEYNNLLSECASKQIKKSFE